jgi:uroporphyrinogen-III decarboxylase
MQIERELHNGTRIDAIGLQFHMFYKKEEEKEKTRLFYDPKHVYEVMDTYARFGKPLQITEVTIPAYSGEEEDETIQADILEKTPPDILVMGNIDPVSVLRHGDPKKVSEETRALLEKCARYPNFVISSGCDMPPMTPWENIDAFFAATDNFYKKA